MNVTTRGSADYTPSGTWEAGMRSILAGVLLWGAACALESGDWVPPIATGEICAPEQVPEGGFSSTEAYLETERPQCESGTCMVYRLQGDPRAICEDTATPNCALRSEVEQRVYCTCRCDAPSGVDECECPSGFSCVPVLELGGPSVEGSYCVRDGTF
jgi:hypothetical protein